MGMLTAMANNMYMDIQRYRLFLIHELIHIVQRYNPSLFVPLYQKWGFTQINEDNMLYQKVNKQVLVTNPDGMTPWIFNIYDVIYYPTMVLIREYDKPLEVAFVVFKKNDKYYVTSKYYMLKDIVQLRRRFPNYNGQLSHPNEIIANLLAIYILEGVNNGIPKDFINSLK